MYLRPGAIIVIIITAPLSVRFRPESQTIESGSYLLLDCIVDGEPPATITWTRREVTRREATRREARNDGVLISSCSLPNPQRICVASSDYIYISSAEQEDSGVYTCRAERSDEVFLFSADVTVLPLRSKLLCHVNVSI